MTVKELKEILSVFSDNMEVQVSCDRYVREIIGVGITIDIDTNVNYVDIEVQDRLLMIR